MKDYDKDYNLDTFYELSELEQAELIVFCKQFTATNRFNHFHTSYGLKQQFKRFYVTNAQFKKAMLLVGFRCENEFEQNWCFNISTKSVEKVYKFNREMRRINQGI